MRVDIWFWVVVIVAAAVVALVIVGKRSARSRVDPTQVSIDPALAAKVRALYAKGDKVQAVKDLRAATGLGVADAIRIADKLGATDKSAPAGPSLTKDSTSSTSTVSAGIGPDHDAEIREMVKAGNQIGAIKRVHELTGMSLKEAKKHVETIARDVGSNG
jgi:ribosomal protein L7/L12